MMKTPWEIEGVAATRKRNRERERDTARERECSQKPTVEKAGLCHRVDLRGQDVLLRLVPTFRLPGPAV